MSYKLEVEKAHRKTKGGTVSRKIEKRTPFGRILRIFQAENRTDDHYVHVHATCGSKIRRMVIVGFPQKFMQLPA